MLDDLVTKLSARTFELSLPACELRQCGSHIPQTYSGAGFIRQEADGELVLRMFATEELDERERAARFFPKALKPGVLVPDANYYDLVATDQGGNTWRAERQSIKELFGVGNEIHVRLRGLEQVRELPKTSPSAAQMWFVPGKFELPWHVQTRTERSMSVDRFEFENDTWTWKVRKAEGGIDVQLTVKAPPLEPHNKRFLRALGMLVGQVLEPLVSSRVEGESLITRIHGPVAKVATRLTGPMELRIYEQDDAHRFLLCCMTRGEQPNPKPIDQMLILYRFWHRIARAQHSDIENSSLVLSVAIEGVLKALFRSEYDADVEFAGHLRSALPTIDALAVHERVRASLKKSLENAALPKAKDVMQRLREQRVLTEAHIKAWNDLRHAGAHGALLEDDDVKFQRHLDRYFCCLDLFYRLVFVAVGYRGQCVDRSRPGWPKSDFPASADADIADSAPLPAESTGESEA